MTSPSERRCPVHDLPLVESRVRPRYGLVVFPDGYHEAARRSFPFSREPPPGGCLLPGEPRTVLLEVCSACEKARRAWWRPSAESHRSLPD